MLGGWATLRRRGRERRNGSAEHDRFFSDLTVEVRTGIPVDPRAFGDEHAVQPDSSGLLEDAEVSNRLTQFSDTILGLRDKWKTLTLEMDATASTGSKPNFSPPNPKLLSFKSWFSHSGRSRAPTGRWDSARSTTGSATEHSSPSTDPNPSFNPLSTSPGVQG